MVRTRRDGPRRAAASLCVLLLLGAVAVVLPAGAPAEQASQPSSTAAGQLDAGSRHTCAVLADSRVRCWGVGRDGELGYGNKETIGDDETPGSVGPVDLGTDLGMQRTALAVSAGDVHSCALLDNGSVRCWGFPGNGRLGYADPTLKTIGDDETPGSVGPVDLGGPAVAISAGGAHTCAILAGESGLVRCWGFGFDGQLGYGMNPVGAFNIGDDETPASVGPVDLGGPAVAIAAGGLHTCAILAGPEGKVRCWGLARNGQLGYGNYDPNKPNNIGDNETPASVAPVELGGPAVAISAGRAHTCAVLQGGAVRCWGTGGNGELGYNSTNTIGDNETPASVPPVALGGAAVAVSASEHSCARLENGSVRCWGYGGNGRLGYGNTNNIGDNETPVSVEPVKLGLGLTATSIAAGDLHTCARLNDGNVRCWGYALNGRLGYCNSNSIGDDETPDAAGPVALTPGPACPPPPDPPTGGGSGTTPGDGGSQTGGGIVQPVPSVPPSGDSSRKPVDPLALQARRARDLRSCLAKAKRVTRSKRDSARRACMKRYGRTPGAVKGLKGAGKSKSSIVLSFTAPGTDGARPPAARSYLVKQSPSKIASARDFTRAQKLCKGRCRFTVTRVGTKINLTITNLRPKTTYYYAVAALDNVSARPGPRSAAVKAKTR